MTALMDWRQPGKPHSSMAPVVLSLASTVKWMHCLLLGMHAVYVAESSAYHAVELTSALSRSTTSLPSVALLELLPLLLLSRRCVLKASPKRRVHADLVRSQNDVAGKVILLGTPAE